MSSNKNELGIAESYVLTCLRVCARACVYMRVCVCMSVCACVYMHVCSCIGVVCAHTCKHVYTLITSDA